MDTESSVVSFYENGLAKHLDSISGDLIDIDTCKKITSKVGELFGSKWRNGESLLLSENENELSDLISGELEIIRDINVNKEEVGEVVERLGLLKINIKKLESICELLTHIFITGEESEYMKMLENINTVDVDKRESVITSLIHSEKPPPVPVINVDTYFSVIFNLVCLLIVRDIVNEAFNDGMECEDKRENSAFAELKSVLYSIADAHKCSCGARIASNEKYNTPEDSDDDTWKYMVGQPDNCKCIRGGGFNVDILCSAIVDQLGNGDSDNSPADCYLIADEIFFCDLLNNEDEDDGDEEEDEEEFVTETDED